MDMQIEPSATTARTVRVTVVQASSVVFDTPATLGEQSRFIEFVNFFCVSLDSADKGIKFSYIFTRFMIPTSYLH